MDAVRRMENYISKGYYSRSLPPIWWCCGHNSCSAARLDIQMHFVYIDCYESSILFILHAKLCICITQDGFQKEILVLVVIISVPLSRPMHRGKQKCGSSSFIIGYSHIIILLASTHVQLVECCKIMIEPCTLFSYFNQGNPNNVIDQCPF